MRDEELYLRATEELEGNNKNLALWAKSLALTEGDESKAKFKYINLRVEALKNENDSHESQSSSETSQLLQEQQLVGHEKLHGKLVESNIKVKRCPHCKKYSLNDIRCSCGESLTTTTYSSIPTYTEWSSHHEDKEEINYLYWLQELYDTECSQEVPTGMVRLELYSHSKGLNSNELLEMVKAGSCSGKKIENHWFINENEMNNLLDEQRSNEELANIPLKWFYFWVYFSLPITVFTSILGSLVWLFEDKIFLAILLFSQGALSLYATVGLHKRKQWGWSFNWAVLWVGALAAMLVPLTLTGNERLTAFLINLVVCIIWLSLNNLYWSKRKRLFN